MNRIIWSAIYHLTMIIENLVGATSRLRIALRNLLWRYTHVIAQVLSIIIQDWNVPVGVQAAASQGLCLLIWEADFRREASHRVSLTQFQCVTLTEIEDVSFIWEQLRVDRQREPAMVRSRVGSESDAPTFNTAFIMTLLGGSLICNRLDRQGSNLVILLLDYGRKLYSRSDRPLRVLIVHLTRVFSASHDWLSIHLGGRYAPRQASRLGSSAFGQRCTHWPLC